MSYGKEETIDILEREKSIQSLRDDCSNLQKGNIDGRASTLEKIHGLDKASKRAAKLYDTILPLDAVKLAKSSLVYQLSKTVFGSLLAAYILGFIGFSMGKLVKVASIGSLEVLYSIAPYVLVSVAFAYSTASAFLTYHEIVVASPAPSPDRVGLDWLIPLLQGILFGLAMLYPNWLAATLLVQLVLLSYRRNIERKGICNAIQKILSRQFKFRQIIENWAVEGGDRKVEEQKTKAKDNIRNYILLKLSDISWGPGELTRIYRSFAVTFIFFLVVASPLIKELLTAENFNWGDLLIRLSVLASVFWGIRLITTAIRSIKKKWPKSIPWFSLERERTPWGHSKSVIIPIVALGVIQFLHVYVVALANTNEILKQQGFDGELTSLIFLAVLTSFMITNSESGIIASAGFDDEERYHLEDDGKGLSGIQTIQLQFIIAITKIEEILLANPWEWSEDYRKWENPPKHVKEQSNRQQRDSTPAD